MGGWLILALLASLCYGLFAVVAKLATSSQHGNVAPASATMLMLVGIAVVVSAYFALSRPTLPTDAQAIGLSVLAGALWALGAVFVYIALSSGVEVARVAPVANTNTLVAVIIGILFLKEVPDQQLRVLIGALLVVIGGVLVSI